MTDIIDQYKQLHNEKHPRWKKDWFPGKSIKWHLKKIKELIETYKVETMLDFGCGQGYQYSKWNMHKEWGGLLPTLYDPAVPKHEKFPRNKFDAVIATDVMEHIPDEDLDKVLKQIFSKAKKVVFLSIALFKTGDLLPDGRDVHVTVETPDWWKERIRPFIPKSVDCHVSWRHKGHFEDEKI